MATAKEVESVDNFMTCPVCQEIFLNPQLLWCQHSLCGNCVDRMLECKNTRNSRRNPRILQCPICRFTSNENQIKVDFKMKNFIDAKNSVFNTFDSTQHQVKHSDAKMCQLCQKTPVVKICEECVRLVCEACSDIHREIPNCRKHTISGLQNVVHERRSDITSLKANIEGNQTLLRQKMIDVISYEADVEKLCENLIETANQWKDATIAKITQHHDSIVDQINNIKGNELKDITTIKTGLQSRDQKINDSLTKCNEIEDEKDVPKYLGKSDKLFEETEWNKHLKDNLSSLSARVNYSSFPDITLSQGQKWNERNNLVLNINKQKDINVMNVLLSSSNPSPTFPKQILTGTFVHRANFQVCDFTKQLLFQNGNIWCLYENRIDIYTIQGTWINSIADNISHANGMTCIHNNVFIATMGHGLLHYKQSGEFISQLKEGVHCDVTNDKRKTLFCLDYNQNQPHIITYTKSMLNGWTQTQRIQLPYENLNPCNTILWSGRFILTVSSTDEGSSLYRYHHSGVLLETQLWANSMSRLCCADRNGHVLFSDPIQNSIGLFHNIAKKRYDLNINLDKRVVSFRPHCLTVDDNSGIWVNNNSKTVICFELQ